MSRFLTKAFVSQAAFIPAPPLTEENLPDQSGRVHLVTGGYAGVGGELSKILYGKGATVYIAGRSEEKANQAIERIKKEAPSSSGRLEFLLLDLNDLATIKASAERFLSQQSRLDVLVNNAGIMTPPAGSKTKQGHDLQFGTNCLGPFLFTKCLMPILTRTAASSPPGSVRVLWAASSAIQVFSPDGGVAFDDTTGAPKIFNSQQKNYGQTKVGNVLLAVKTGELYASQGVLSVSFNPGNLKTELQRHSTGLLMRLAQKMLYPAIFGAYTELYSGWSEEITADKGVTYVVPWGKDGSDLVRQDIQEGIRNGLATRFWDWCESETKLYS
ncbi:Putative oxidoreductase [Tolypocladium paradoxum]|uniref:Oxidoreductase n=1 Tax=Tolypocladium paradoxum TaxID=94208 RepID=A0A2S4KSA2_9HYPO|nr:Putative oxidoreductase [Tolypocladium paradoxum]